MKTNRGNHFTALKISCMFRDDISQLFCCQLIPISLNSNGLLDNLGRHGGLTDGFCSCGFSTSHHDSTSDNRATVLGSCRSQHYPDISFEFALTISTVPSLRAIFRVEISHAKGDASHLLARPLAARALARRLISTQTVALL